MSCSAVPSGSCHVVNDAKTCSSFATAKRRPSLVRIWCSQILTTLLSASERLRFTWASRTMFPAIFRFQYERFCFGIRRHFGQPCQKHPSMNTATDLAGNQKSGVPGTFSGCNFQPVTPALTRPMRSFTSVDRLPRERTLPIWRLRSDLESESMLCRLFRHGAKAQ